MAESPMDTSTGQGPSQLDNNNDEDLPQAPHADDSIGGKGPENGPNLHGKPPENFNIHNTRSRSAEANKKGNLNIKKEQVEEGPPFPGKALCPGRGRGGPQAGLPHDGGGGGPPPPGVGGTGPLHQTPDTTGSPEVETPDNSLHHAQKRPAEDGHAQQGVGVEAGSVPLQQRPKRVRRMYTQEQVQVLEKTFQNNEYPTAEDRNVLSAITLLTTEKVKVWFQNRRSRERRRRQNQLNNQSNTKRLQGCPTSKVSPSQTSPSSYPTYPTVGNGPTLTLTRGYGMPPPSNARGPQAASPSSSGQQWVQVWSPSSSPTFASPSPCSSTSPGPQPTLLTDLNNNNNNNNPINTNALTGMGQSLRPLKIDNPAMVKQGPLTSLYSQMTRSGYMPSAAAGSAPPDKEGPLVSSSSSKQGELGESSYTPLHAVPSWSQSWPVFQSQTNLNVVNPIKKITPMGQAEGFCMDNGKWLDNQGNLNHLPTGNYGMGGSTAGEGLANSKSFQEHYSYAAMIPTGYLHYGYPYYSNMYQTPQVGFYPQQPPAPQVTSPPPPAASSSMSGYLRPDPPTTKAYHQVTSQTVRMALQRKLDLSRRTYSSPVHCQPPSPCSNPPPPQPHGLGPHGLVLKRECVENNNNDVLSDSSTLSSPERGGRSPVKPLATSSPNTSQPPDACSDLPFPMAEKLSSSELLNTMGAAHFMWPQQPASSHPFSEPMDKNNNFMDIGGHQGPANSNVNPLTPYPNVAGYYNDPYTPVTSASYSQSTTSSWGNVNVANIGGSFTYKFPDWPPVVSADPMVTATGGGDSSYKSSFSCPFTVIEPVRVTGPTSNFKSPSSTCDTAYPMSPAAPSPVSVSDVRTTTTPAHSDISSYGASDNEHDGREMAPPASAPGGGSQLMGCDDPTCRQGDASPGGLCGGPSMGPSDVYNISDTE